MGTLSNGLIGKILLKNSLVGLLIMLSVGFAKGQTTFSGTGNWSNPARWSAGVPGAGVAATIANGSVCTVDVPANCLSLNVSGGGTATTVNIDGSNSLTVVNNVAIGAGTGNGDNIIINVAAGSLSCGSMSIAATGNNNRNSGFTLSTGTVTVLGNITIGDARDIITFTGSGTLFVGGNLGAGATFTRGTGTVEFNGTGAQTIPAYNYYNITISGVRTTSNVTLVNGGTIGVSNVFSPTATFTTGNYINTNNTVDFNGTGAQTIPAFNYNNLTISGARTTNSITLANTGTIGIAGTFTNSATFTTGGYIVTGSTVNYNGNAAQNVIGFTYNNLTISVLNATAARAKTLTGTGTVNGDFVVTGTTAANTTTFNSAGLNFTVNGSTTINAYGIVTDDNAGGVNTFVGLVDINANASLTSTSNSNYIFRGGITNNGTFTKAGTGSTTFNTNSQSISGSSTLTFSGGDIVISDPVSLDVSTSISFSGTNFTNNSNAIPAFNASAGNFTFALNNNQSISGTGTGTISFNDLTVSGGAGTKTANRPFSVINDLTVNTGTTLTTAFGTASTYSVGGNLSLNGTGTLNLGTVGNILNVSGSATIDGTLNFGTGVAKTVNIAGDLINITGTINMSGAGLAHNLNLSGAANALTTLTTTAGSGSTVTYNRAGDQTVFGSNNYINLTISGGGNKSLQAVSAVATTLTLNSGVLQLGNNNLTLNNNAVTAVQGTLSGTSMVETNGNGYVIRNAAATTPILFPVGSNSLYSPVSINSTNPTTGTISARTVQSGALGAKYVQRYWDLITSAAGPYTITATFDYNISEITTSPTFIKYKPGAGVWQNPVGTTSFGATSFTITGTTNITNAVTSWTAGTIGTYFSYQTGDWNTPTTWTSDPGGSTQVGSTVPGNDDVAVILNGRTVSLSSNVTNTGLDVTINSGGFLNMGTSQFTNTLLALRGKGTLRLASVNFPTATTNTLINAGEGTVEYNNAADFNIPVAQTTYNNLTINAPGVIATQMNNLTLNGNLYVKSGTYRINDNSAVRRQLTINGDVTVDNGASLTVGTGNTTDADFSGGTAPYTDYYDRQTHRVVVYGNITNNGTIRFTNQPYPVYNAFSTTGAATVYFRGATNNTLACNNTTDFYNLVLDKGVDQSYSLTINSSAYNNFRLFGRNDLGGENGGANPDLRKALWVRTGSLVLTGLTIIPSLSEANSGGSPNGDFYIPANGALVLNGPDVIVLATADDYREVNLAYGVAAPNNGTIGVLNGGGTQSFSIYGKLQINDGYFSARESGGFITWDLAAGQFIINGGIVDAKQFRAAGGAGGLSSFTQSGGLFLLRGRFQRTPTAYSSIDNLKDFSTATLNTARSGLAIEAIKGSFNLNNAANVFGMSGGTIRVYDVCGNAAAEQKAFEILSSSGNINVTGGTLEVIPTTGTLIADPANYYIETTAKLGNFTVNRASGAAVVGLRNYALTILSNINLTAGDFNANNLDVTVGGNFTIAAGTTYTTGTNRTIFSGSGTQSVTINLATALSLYKLKIEKPTGTELRYVGTQINLNVVDSLRIISGIFRTYNRTVNCSGNIENNGSIITTTGYLVLNSDAARTISGDGNGIFTNLELNKPNAGTADVTITNNIRVNGVLRFSGAATGYKRLNLQEYNLLMSATASVTGADVNRFAYTKGEVGNGSISKIYSTTSTSFTFPIGAPSTSHVGTPVFTPATISFSSNPTTYGTITVVPVGDEHFATSVKNRSLTYYWRVKSQDFVGVVAGSVSHSYTYDQSDVITGLGITENEYVPARFDVGTVTWTNGTNASIDIGNNVINGPWLSGVDYIEGDFTAGDNNPTSPFGAPLTFYSRNSGWWGDPANWSLTSHTVDDAPAIAPGATDIVIIGNGHEITLNTNITTPDTDVRSCASLQIETGASLDIGYNPGCNFNVVSSHPNGNGLFRLTTTWTSGNYFTFPTGDFSDFNVNLGTTELYSTNPAAGTTYWLPNNINKYGNLIISPLGGSNIIFGNTDVLIYGNCITQGQNADSWFLPTWNVNYPGGIARISKTITINGNLDIQGGSFGWYGGNAGGAQNVVVHGDVIVAPLAGIDVWSSNTSQAMSIGGSLINNSTNTIAGGTTTRSYVNLTLVPLTFFGSGNASVTNTASTPRTDFGQVTVNKGSSQATTLTVNIGGTLNTPTNNWLTLQNGTLIYQRTGDLSITTTSTFTIPGTSGLQINTPSNVYIARSNVNTNDLFLNGKLTVISGTVYVGREAGTDANNNDIEYGGGGLSEIDMQGGTLMVNGQIRMNTASTAGVLKYRQSGTSRVIINGQAANNTKAKLEVYNPGSVFNMSGSSSLTIVRGGGGNTYGDLYIRAASSSAGGSSTINFTQTPVFGPVVDAVQSYLLDANVPLNNLTITGKTAGTPQNATVTLLISPLVMNGDLTISNARSILDANTTYDINVTVKGGFTNNGTYNHYNNVTTFSGGVQTIGGTTATDFYDLVVSPVTSLSLIRDITVLNDLTLSSGQLLHSTYNINVKGDMTNNANYDGDALAGGVILNGTVQQEISGTGTFGRLELNNTNGARINNNISLQKNIKLTNGIFNINQHLLTLGVNSSIEGSGFGPTKMFASDGVYSNVGLRKYFPIYSGPELTFTYPIGTSNKYTPAILKYTDNTNVGYIRLNNINDNHPGVIDPTNVLDYFWEVESNGIAGFNGSLTLNYLEEDVVLNGYTEALYIPAVLLIPGSSWSKYSAANVDEANNTILFNFSSSSNLSGEYTAGVDPALPDAVPEFTSINDGDWSNPANWIQTGGDPYVLTGAPNGFMVIIDTDDEVTTDNNYSSAYRTTIKGKLIIDGSTFGHNLGNVSGTGTLYLESATFPAGRYNDFFDCSNDGILEYGGSTNYNIIADLYNTVPRLYFTGTGSRVLPNKDLTICRRLLIDGPTLDNSLNNRKLTIQGTMERLAGTFNSGSGAGAIVSFNGTSSQTIGGALGNFTGTSDFNHFEINNNSGLTINVGGAIEVAGNLMLTSGLINTSATATLTITNTAINCVTPSGGKSTSFVNGPLTKRISQGDNFIFPIGKGTALGNKIRLSSTQTGTILWTVEYFDPNTTFSSFTAPISYVNAQEYWTVSAASGSQAVVNLSWDPTSDLTPLMTENGLSDMRVVYYNTGTTSWEEVSSTATGDDNNGTVYTSSRITIPVAGSSNFTIGCINVTKPRARFNFSGSICGDVGIPVVFTGVDALNLNFVLGYKKGGVAQAPITVSSLPFLLPTDAIGDTYQLTSFTYNNPPHGAPILTGVVDATIVTTYTVPTTAAAGLDQSICGATSATLDANTPAVGSGLWSVSGAGGTVVFPTVPDSEFNGTNGSTYTLTWTISNGGCTSSDDVVIAFPLLPEKPAAFILSDNTVCQGDNDVDYSVANNPSLTYNWSYTVGSGATITGSGNAIEIDYDGTATSGNVEVYTTNGCGDSDPLILAVTVNTRPVFTVSGSATDICDGDLFTLTTSFTSINVPYSIDIILDGISVVGSPFSSSDTPDYIYDENLAWVGPSAGDNRNYTVTVVDVNGCSTTTLVPISVDVWKTPETGPQYHVPNTFGF